MGALPLRQADCSTRARHVINTDDYSVKRLIHGGVIAEGSPAGAAR